MADKYWVEEEVRMRQLDEKVRQTQKAQFGYEAILETEKEKRVLNHFNTIARKYDIMNTILSFGIHYLWKRTAIKMLGLKPGEKILDVCGGTGDLSVLAAKAMKGQGRPVLYDINREMMTTGRAKPTNAYWRGKIEFVQGDAEKLAFSDDSFDAVMVSFGIRNVTHMQDGFKEMYRILKPGGRMLCLEFSKPTAPLFCRLYDFYSFTIMPLLGDLIVGSRKAYLYLPESIRLFPLPAELKNILEQIGFRNVKYRLLTNGIAVAHVGMKG